MFIICETFTFCIHSLAVWQHCYAMIIPNGKLSTGVFWDKQCVYNRNCSGVFCSGRWWHLYYYSAQEWACLSKPGEGLYWRTAAFSQWLHAELALCSVSSPGEVRFSSFFLVALVNFIYSFVHLFIHSLI